ncbi:protein kinase [Candidatus Woesearchaeota archaeon]|nr:protein kinase [Candidatus Woesearchaeota archaeon]
MSTENFDFPEGEIINGKYEIIASLGRGWQGEVYLIKELSSGIERAAKFFFPKRNPHGRTSKFYAKKLHKLNNCSIVIQYYTQDTVFIDGSPVFFLVSEFIEGELLGDFLKRQHGKHLHPFAALHLLHSLASGMECVHRLGEYHGDLHVDNIIVQRSGLKFELKLLDLYSWGRSAEHIRDDVVEMIKIFYEVLGGKKHYAKLPKCIKDICCGLKRSLILKKFRTAGKLKEYIENLEWD